MVSIVYLAEAHFVERDASGQYVDGWPIGYEHEYEIPQHKTLEDRLVMAERCLRDTSAGMSFFAEADIVVTDSMNNEFHNFFGVWPDDVLVIHPTERTLAFRGRRESSSFRGGGWCLDGFAAQIDSFLGGVAEQRSI